MELNGVWNRSGDPENTSMSPESQWSDFLRKIKIKIMNTLDKNDIPLSVLADKIGVTEEDLAEALDISEDIYLSALYEIVINMKLTIDLVNREQEIFLRKYITSDFELFDKFDGFDRDVSYYKKCSEEIPYMEDDIKNLNTSFMIKVAK